MEPDITLPIDAVPTPPVLDGTPKKRNYLLWILAILALVVISVTSFLILTGKSKSTPTASLIQPSVSEKQIGITVAEADTSNWKTYSDNGAKFSIKYPDKWLNIPGKIYPPPVCPSQKTFQNKDCMDGYVAFKVLGKKSDQLLKEAVQERDKSVSRDDPQYYENNLSQYLLDMGAIQANYMGMYGPLNVYIPINSVANISYLEISSFALDSDIFYQILSTFKFIE